MCGLTNGISLDCLDMYLKRIFQKDGYAISCPECHTIQMPIFGYDHGSIKFLCCKRCGFGGSEMPTVDSWSRWAHEYLYCQGVGDFKHSLNITLSQGIHQFDKFFVGHPSWGLDLILKGFWDGTYVEEPEENPFKPEYPD